MIINILNFFGLTLNSKLISISNELSSLEKFYLNNIFSKEYQISNLKKDLSFYKKASSVKGKINFNEKNYLKNLRSALSELDKMDKDKLKSWATRVKEVGKCDICSSPSFLTAHHLWDKSTHKSLMFQDENGVCLCRDCHNEFHRTYTQASQTTPLLYNKFKIIKKNSLNSKSMV